MLGSSRDRRQNRPGKAKGDQSPSTNLFPSLLPSFPVPTSPPFHPHLALQHLHHVQEVCNIDHSNLGFSSSISKLIFSFSSGLARSFGRAAFARTTPVARAFQPIRSNALPALTARFASTDAGSSGKVHQVIGAVVDGTCCRLLTEWAPRENLFPGPNPSPKPSQSIPKSSTKPYLTFFSPFYSEVHRRQAPCHLQRH